MGTRRTASTRRGSPRDAIRPTPADERTTEMEAQSAPSDVVGFLEEVLTLGGQRVIKGWAFDRLRPLEAVRLLIYVDGEEQGAAACDIDRADLVASGIPRGDCGFVWPIPPRLLDGKPHRVAARAPNGSLLHSLGDINAGGTAWTPLAAPTPAPTPGPTPTPGAEPKAAAPPDPAAREPVGKRPEAEKEPPGLFDAGYYLETYPDVRQTGLDAWTHFDQVGWRDGRNPNLLFDTAYYLATNPEVAAKGENPLVHYARLGRLERRRFHWLFSTAEYQALNGDLSGEMNLLHHMLAHGLWENRRPHVLFDPNHYLAAYPDVARAGTPAFAHYLRSGESEGRSPHPAFLPSYHAAGAGEGAGLRAYVESGGAADPHPLFDTAYYRTKTRWSGRLTPLEHYLWTGGAAGLDPHPAFDTAHYLRQTEDPAARACPLVHYLVSGRKRGLSPNGLFDPAWYAANRDARSWTGAALPRTGPRISVIVPVFNTPASVLRECIESVRQQSYAAWELVIVDDGSRSAETAAVLAGYKGIDPRIRVDRSVTNLHIAKATNRAALQASGEFLAFLDHDDVLEPEALAEVAAAVMAHPDIDMLYCDEDKLDPQGRRTDPYHKPGWSPEHLESVMYVLHMLTVRKSVFWAVGGSRPERTGAQDYDLALRVAAVARRVWHIPRILYHWRMLSGSAAAEVEAKPYALLAARSALEDALAAAGETAVVEDGLLTGTFRVRRSLAAKPAVTLLVFTNDSEREVEGRGRINLLRHFLTSVAERSTYADHAIVVVDNANSSAETKRLVRQLGGRIVSFREQGPFSYARKANFALGSVKTEHVIYLNDDLEVITPGWIEALLEHSVRTEVGGVGGRLLYPNGAVQHSGVLLGVHGATGHAFWNLPRDVVGYNAYTHLVRNYSAVTGAVFATRKAVMEEVGGFDEKLAVDYNDVDLCLRIGETGRRIVFTPYAEFYHFEGSTAVRTVQDPDERALFQERWAERIRFDPFYNPNLPRDRTGFA